MCVCVRVCMCACACVFKCVCSMLIYRDGEVVELAQWHRSGDSLSIDHQIAATLIARTDRGVFEPLGLIDLGF